MLLLLSCCLVFLGFLSLPLDIFISSHRREGSKTEVKYSWAFGLVKLSLVGNRPSIQKEKKKAKTEPKRKRNKNNSLIKGLVPQSSFRAYIFALFRKLIKSVHLRSGHLYLEIGLDDPAQTGQLIGELYAAQFSIIDPGQKFLTVTPVFEGQAFYWDGNACLRIFPLEIFFKLATFPISPTLWRCIYVAKNA
jgi:hypothetical protein